MFENTFFLTGTNYILFKLFKVEFIGGFESAAVENKNEKKINISMIQQQPQQIIPIIPRNAQIILEPLYA